MKHPRQSRNFAHVVGVETLPFASLQSTHIGSCIDLWIERQRRGLDRQAKGIRPRAVHPAIRPECPLVGLSGDALLDMKLEFILRNALEAWSSLPAGSIGEFIGRGFVHGRG